VQGADRGNHAERKKQDILDGSGTLATLDIIRFFPQLVYHETFTLRESCRNNKMAGCSSHLYG
jgi:hypothetical protein